MKARGMLLAFCALSAAVRAAEPDWFDAFRGKAYLQGDASYVAREKSAAPDSPPLFRAAVGGCAVRGILRDAAGVLALPEPPPRDDAVRRAIRPGVVLRIRGREAPGRGAPVAASGVGTRPRSRCGRRGRPGRRPRTWGPARGCAIRCGRRAAPSLSSWKTSGAGRCGRRSPRSQPRPSPRRKGGTSRRCFACLSDSNPTLRDQALESGPPLRAACARRRDAGSGSARPRRGRLFLRRNPMPPATSPRGAASRTCPWISRHFRCFREFPFKESSLRAPGFLRGGCTKRKGRRRPEGHARARRRRPRQPRLRRREGGAEGRGRAALGLGPARPLPERPRPDARDGRRAATSTRSASRAVPRCASRARRRAGASRRRRPRRPSATSTSTSRARRCAATSRGSRTRRTPSSSRPSPNTAPRAGARGRIELRVRGSPRCSRSAPS